MHTSSYIEVKTTFAGTHAWKGCPHDQVAFLRNTHRHIFHVVVTLPVRHDDRDLEFFMVKIVIEDFINKYPYASASGLFILDDRSCEMIAKELAEYLSGYYYGAQWVRVFVSEDNENGAGVLWERV